MPPLCLLCLNVKLPVSSFFQTVQLSHFCFLQFVSCYTLALSQLHCRFQSQSWMTLCLREILTWDGPLYLFPMIVTSHCWESNSSSMCKSVCCPAAQKLQVIFRLSMCCPFCLSCPPSSLPYSPSRLSGPPSCLSCPVLHLCLPFP